MRTLGHSLILLAALLAACSGTPDQRLQRAILGQDPEAAAAALKAGAHVNRKDEDGWTPLMHAAAHGDADTVRLLISAGADLKAATPEKLQPALTLAARWNRVSVIKALLAAGADPRQRDSIGWTALMWASLQGRTDVVAVLLPGGADPNNVDQDGDTPLILAARRGHKDTVQLLLKSGARAGAQTSSGDTAASWAQKSGYPDVAALLQGK